MRFGHLLAGSLTALLSAPSAHGGQVLKFWEEGTRKTGAPYQSSITMRSGPAGVRVDIVETDRGEEPKPFSILYLAGEDRIAPIQPAAGPAVTRDLLSQLDARVKASGHARKPGTFALAPLHTNHVVGKWTATAWSLKRPGQSTELIYFANPSDVGIDEETTRNLKRMGDLFVAFVNKMKLIKGDDLRESFNAYGLEQGFPVREFRGGGGKVEMDAQLVSVENADLPADLFKAPAASARAADPEPDRSLSAEAYIARGLPAPDRGWTGDEYTRAADVIEKVAAGDAGRLPRLGSPKSGGVFSRIVNPANLDITQTQVVDPRLNLQLEGGIAIGLTKVLGVYLMAFQKGARLDDELAEVMSFTVYVSRRLIVDGEAFYSTLPKDDPDMAVRSEGRRKMKDGIAEVVSGTLTDVGNAAGLTPRARLRLARSLEENVPPVRRFLPAGMQQELPVRVRQLYDDEKDAPVKESFGRLLSSLEAGARKTAA